MAERILLLMDNRGDSNWGSQASTSKLVQALKAEFPQAQVRGVGRKMAGRRGLARKVGELVLPTSLRLGSWSDPLTQIALRLNTAGWAHLLDWADLIVMNGEGTLHAQGQVRRWLPLAVYTKHRTKCPLWIVNASLELEHASYRTLFVRALKQADRLVVREPLSAEVARNLGIEPELAADCAFLAEPDEDFSVSEMLQSRGFARPFAVVTGSAIGGHWDVEPSRKVLAAARERGLSLIFAASTSDDLRLRERLDPRLPLVTQRELTPYQYMSLIREAEILIGGRFHPTIFAAKVGTPFLVSESNTHKMKGLMMQLGTPELLIPQDQGEQQVRMLNQILDSRAEYSEKLKARAREFAQIARQNAIGDATRALAPLRDARVSSPALPLIAFAAASVAFFFCPNSWVIFGLAAVLLVALSQRGREAVRLKLRTLFTLASIVALASFGGDLYDGGLVDRDRLHGQEPWYLGL